MSNALYIRFKKVDREYLSFDKVENKLSSRPDLHAFILLNQICPGTGDMIDAAEHDEIWLGIDPEVLHHNATDDQIVELVRCGVRFDGESLQMFV